MAESQHLCLETYAEGGHPLLLLLSVSCIARQERLQQCDMGNFMKEKLGKAATHV